MKIEYNKIIKNRSGFTIIEIVAVLVVLGILAVLTIGSFVGNGRAELAAQTDVIKAHIRLAQMRSMNFSNVIWGIDSNGSTYHLFRLPGTLDINGNITNAGTETQEQFPGEQTVVITVTDKGIDAIESFKICFDNWGTPFKIVGGSYSQLISSDAEAGIIVSNNGDTKTILITQNTGYIP